VALLKAYTVGDLKWNEVLSQVPKCEGPGASIICGGTYFAPGTRATRLPTALSG
jgi:hypothetical protein